jgi:hypothetical protein
MGDDLNVSIGTRTNSNNYPEEEENDKVSPLEMLIGPVNILNKQTIDYLTCLRHKSSSS